jgi:hypothetical protein
VSELFRWPVEFVFTVRTVVYALHGYAQCCRWTECPDRPVQVLVFQLAAVRRP